MPAPPYWSAPRRRRFSKRFQRDLKLFAAAFAALFVVAVMAWPAFDAADRSRDSMLAVVGAAGAFIALAFWRPLWHRFANHIGVKPARPLRYPQVIDGDTIEDRFTGVRYRLANIDAPETGDNARCHRERVRGEMATRAAAQLLRTACVVSVRETFRVDRYGRRVAFVLADGEDVGRVLIARGLAVPWAGWRRRWCGPKGGLARIARTGAMAHRCKTCRA